MEKIHCVTFGRDVEFVVFTEVIRISTARREETASSACRLLQDWLKDLEPGKRNTYGHRNNEGNQP